MDTQVLTKAYELYLKSTKTWDRERVFSYLQFITYLQLTMDNCGYQSLQVACGFILGSRGEYAQIYDVNALRIASSVLDTLFCK